MQKVLSETLPIIEGLAKEEVFNLHTNTQTNTQTNRQTNKQTHPLK